MRCLLPTRHLHAVPPLSPAACSHYIFSSLTFSPCHGSTAYAFFSSPLLLHLSLRAINIRASYIAVRPRVQLLPLRRGAGSTTHCARGENNAKRRKPITRRVAGVGFCTTAPRRMRRATPLRAKTCRTRACRRARHPHGVHVFRFNAARRATPRAACLGLLALWRYINTRANGPV